MEEKEKYVIFKKLLIFGEEGVGKTALSTFLSPKDSKEEEKPKSSKHIFLLFYYIYFNRC
jgi:Cdc6-like AAA superfamily ATPase